MQLLVRQALSGRTAVVEAAPGDTVVELKRKLAQVRPVGCSLPPLPQPTRRDRPPISPLLCCLNLRPALHCLPVAACRWTAG